MPRCCYASVSDTHTNVQRAQTAPAGKYKNTLDILKQTVRNEGVLALYKGMVGHSGASSVEAAARRCFALC